MPQYKISGLIINIESDTSRPFKYMNNFLDSDMKHGKVDLNFIFNISEFLQVPKGNVISDEDGNPIKWLKKTSGKGGYYLYVQEFGAGGITVVLDVDSDWRSAVISWCDFKKSISGERYYTQTQAWAFAHIMTGIVFRYYLLHYDGLVIHASTLKWQGKGLMFSAPSGTGKSTHVKLWQEYMEDIIVLNDDTPAVRIINNIPYVFGTPWSGSSFINSNDSAPLAGIVVLEQSQHNVIRRITNQEAILKLMPRVFLPYFDENLMNIAITTFEKIIVSVPIYLLKCRPDKEAVELVCQCVK